MLGGTITVPDPLPTPSQDAENLRKAFKGWGTDEKAIISILGHRNADQRLKIRQTYHDSYEESLIDSLKSELSGDFGKAVILWALYPPERDAKLASEALRKKGVKHVAVIVEIACASSPHHLIAVRQAYCSLFNCSLEEDITLYVAQPLRKLLLALVSSYRYDREVVDENIANLEADKLHDAIKKRQLDREDVIWILSTRNKTQLKATFNSYKQVYVKPIDQEIKECGDSDFLSLLQTAVWCIETPENHFAEVIRSSIVGIGTDEDSLTRAIVTRAEIDMLKIKEAYYKENKGSLVDAVIGDTSGDYKDFLLTLLGEGKL
ncbi:annexin D3-like [Magnolia sinica]|uniref:annexin D3-like n=1 Tax=Magnolia sinica TaxID=86752 RepID=UPI00265AD2CC|nr:annexin D3-like [Magnolia sinica]